MTDDDPTSPECEPTARGIKACLRMLADEAATLHLVQTMRALRAALDVCEAETIPGDEGAAMLVSHDGMLLN